MKPLRSWSQFGLLLAISTWTALNTAHSDDPGSPTADAARPAAVSPDVVTPDAVVEDEAVVNRPKTDSPQASERLRPEPETTLPTTTAMPPTGDSTGTPKPTTPMDIDAQFEPPIEVNPQAVNPSASATETWQ